jgi:hypothetical protein
MPSVIHLDLVESSPVAFDVVDGTDMTFEIIEGPQITWEIAGLGGPPGLNATIEIGTVTTGDPGTDADVVNVGTETEAILDFTIPAGAAATVDVGDTITGPPGSDASVVNVGTSSAAIFEFTIPLGDNTTYEHVQSAPATTWTIAHNLGFKPAITILDSAGSKIETDIQHIDNMTATSTTSFPFAGTAPCS